MKQKRHGWDKDAWIYHNAGQEYPSWWKSIMGTPEWKAWYYHATTNHLFDVDESAECGWMSPEHAMAFLKFVRTYKKA